MPGTKNLDAHAGLCELLQDSAENPKIKLAAICAAPSVFGNLGLLNGEKAVCYPGFEDQLIGATVLKDPVVVSNQFITARGAGAAMKFALKLVEVLKGKTFADELADAIVYNK
jgi:protein deglycase